MITGMDESELIKIVVGLSTTEGLFEVGTHSF